MRRTLNPPPRVTPPRPPLHLFEPADKKPVAIRQPDFTPPPAFDDDVAKEMRRLEEDILRSMGDDFSSSKESVRQTAVNNRDDDDLSFEEWKRRQKTEEDYMRQRKVEMTPPSSYVPTNPKHDIPQRYEPIDSSRDKPNYQQPSRHQYEEPPRRDVSYNQPPPSSLHVMAHSTNNRQQSSAPPSQSPRANPQTSLALGMDKMDEVALKRLKQQEYKNQLDRMASPADTLKATTNRNNDSLQKHSQQQLVVNTQPEQSFTNHNDAQRLYRERMNAKVAPSPLPTQVIPDSYKPLHSHNKQSQQQEVVGGGSGMLFGSDKDRELAAKKAKQLEYRRQLEQQTVPKQSLVQQHQNIQQQVQPSQQQQRGGISNQEPQYGRNQPPPRDHQSQYNPSESRPDERYRQFSPRGSDPYDEPPMDMEREHHALMEQRARVEALRRVEEEYQRNLSPDVRQRAMAPPGGMREDFDHREERPQYGAPNNNRDADYPPRGRDDGRGDPRGRERDRDPRDNREGGYNGYDQHQQGRGHPSPQQPQYDNKPSNGYEPSPYRPSAVAQHSPNNGSNGQNQTQEAWKPSGNDRAGDAKRKQQEANKAYLETQMAAKKAEKEAEKKREAEEDKRRMDKFEAEKQAILDAEKADKDKKKAIEKAELMEKQAKAEREAFAKKNRHAAPPVVAQSTPSNNNRPLSGSNPQGQRGQYNNAPPSVNPAASLDQEHDEYLHHQQGHAPQDRGQHRPQHDPRDDPDYIDPSMQARMRARYDAEQAAAKGRGGGGGGGGGSQYGGEEEEWHRAQQQRGHEETEEEKHRRWDLQFEQERRQEEQQQQQQQQRRPDEGYRPSIETTGPQYGDASYTTSPQKSPGHIARNRHVSDIYGSNPINAGPVAASGVPQGAVGWKPSGKQLSERDRAGVADQKSALAAQMADQAIRKKAEKDKEDAEDRKREEDWLKKLAAEKAFSDAQEAKRRGKVVPEVVKPVIAAPAITTPVKQQQHQQQRREPERERDHGGYNDRDNNNPPYQHKHDDRHGPPPKVSGYPGQSPDRSNQQYGQQHATRESEGINSPLKDLIRNSHQSSQQGGGPRYEDELRNSREYSNQRPPAEDSMDSFVSNYAQRMHEQEQARRDEGRGNHQQSHGHNYNRDSRDSRDSYQDRDNHQSQQHNQQQQQRMQSIPERSRYGQQERDNYNNSQNNTRNPYNDRSHLRDEEEEEGSFLVQESTLVPINPYRNSDLLSSLAPLGQMNGHSSPPRKQHPQSSMNSNQRYQSPAHRPTMDMEKSLAGYSAYEYLGRRTPNVEGRQSQQQQQQVRPSSAGRPRTNGAGAAAGTASEQRPSGAPYATTEEPRPRSGANRPQQQPDIINGLSRPPSSGSRLQPSRYVEDPLEGSQSLARLIQDTNELMQAERQQGGGEQFRDDKGYVLKSSDVDRSFEDDGPRGNRIVIRGKSGGGTGTASTDFSDDRSELNIINSNDTNNNQSSRGGSRGRWNTSSAAINGVVSTLSRKGSEQAAASRDDEQDYGY